MSKASDDAPAIAYPELISRAIAARMRAYAPYSGFMVGAALLSVEGEVYTGCNIENAAFTPTVCAERTAFFQAVAAGRRRFTALALVGALKDSPPSGFGYVFPCGVCRQVMAEFCRDDFQIIAAKSPADYQVFFFSSLLPEAFGPRDLAVNGDSRARF